MNANVHRTKTDYGTAYGAVDGEGLVHMNNHKVIVPGLCARELLRVELRRSLRQAYNGIEVGFAVGLGEVTPE